ncbi:T9SS type A sorting domain-containing protein, partial [Flavobacterium sp. Sd200]|uniref:Ig-like domain-containing protein n=1 Tax=Flavobacterium sp. Sd200 TaxID=2692211 RepID=UPI001369DAD8
TLNSCESTRTAVAVTINTTASPTASAQTFCSGATVVNLVANGTSLKWYSVATGGTQLASNTALATGTYYVSQTLNSCESTRTTVAVTINITAAPTASAQTFCVGATIAELIAEGTDLAWYSDATSTVALASTEVLATSTYYVSQTLNSCESTRTAVAVTINTTAEPTADAQTFCNGATVAELTAEGTDLAWYADETSTVALASTQVLATSTYYVSQTLNSCESTRTAVAVTINTTAEPTADAQTFCVGATVAEFIAEGTDLAWYADATSATALASTEVLATGTYYVSQTLNACESTRTAVSVTINTTAAPTAAAQTFCNGATVAELTAEGTDLAWYADETSTVALASTEVLATGTYYVSQTLNACESVRTAVAVTINTTAVPTADAQTFCNGATVAELTAEGTDLVWYADATSTTTLTSTEILATGTYYVSQTLNACESVRTAVAVTINTTTAPIADAQTFCNGATVAELTAEGTDLAWYADATSATALTSTEVLVTGTYYVSQTLNACESTRTAVAVTINTTTAPIADAQTFCNGATVAELTAEGTDLAWYASETSTTALTSTEVLATGTYYVSQTLNACESVRTAVSVTINTTAAPTADAQTFCTGATVAELVAEGTDLAWYSDATSTTALTSTEVLATGTYYVSQTLNACESTRTAVSVTINTTAAPTADTQTFCNGATVAQLTAEGTDLAWYDNETSTTALASTEVLATGTYYVSQTVNGCDSTRTAVAVTINTTAAPTAAAQTFCNGATVAELTATGDNLVWYANETSTTALTSTEVLAAGTYYVSQTLNACESTRTAVSVTINTTTAPTASAQTFCNGATVVELTAEGTDLAWYASETSTTALTSTEVLATGTYYVSQTLNACESTRTAVSVTINTTAAPDGLTQQAFNSTDNATIADIEVIGEGVLWYASEDEALNGGTPLSSDTVLENAVTYYATQTVNGCTSQTTLAVTISIILGNDHFTQDTFKYYPNPVDTELNIESSQNISNVAVYDLHGKLVFEVKWNVNKGKLNMSTLQAASYIVRVTTGNKVKNLTIIKK